MNAKQKETAHRVAIMSAFLDGQTIQFKRKGDPDIDDNWIDCYWPKWRWEKVDYRISTKNKSIPPEVAMAKAYCAHPGKLHAMDLFAEATNDQISPETADLMWSAINEYVRLQNGDS